MTKFSDLSGRVFSEWTVLFLSERIDGRILYRCRCSCGIEKDVRSHSLRKGDSKSCGTHAKSHGDTRARNTTRFYRIWQAMKSRTLNKENPDFRRYGGRGIKLDPAWGTYDAFKKDMYIAYLEHVKNHGALNTSIDRLDNNGPYSIENCHWATCKEQSNNRRSNHFLIFNGVSKTLAGWAVETGIEQTTLRRRIVNYGFSIGEALTRPVRFVRRHVK